MFIDCLSRFSDSQSVVSSAFGTGVIDLGDPAKRGYVGPGQQLWAIFNIVQSADFTTGDETYQFELVTSSNADLSSSTTLAKRAIAAADLTADFTFTLGLPKNSSTLRYLGVHYTLGGTTPAVTVTAWSTDQEPSERSVYPSAVTQPV